jgi:hypothetical protein
MRKVILSTHVTLDGFMAGPNGELDWVTMDEEIDNSLLPELLSTADTALIGRVLYQVLPVTGRLRRLRTHRYRRAKLSLRAG